MKKKAHWPGDWLAVCDVCGFRYPSSALMKRWDGYMVCDKDFESRHPQTLYNYKTHTSVPDYVRPEGEDQFILVCTAAGSSAYTGLAEAGCMIAGNNSVPYQTLLDMFGNGH